MMKARIHTAFAKNNKKDYVFTLLVSKADMRNFHSVGCYESLGFFCSSLGLAYGGNAFPSCCMKRKT